MSVQKSWMHFDGNYRNDVSHLYVNGIKTETVAPANKTKSCHYGYI